MLNTIKKIFAGMLITCIGIVFLAGCQKEESAMPVSESNSYNALKHPDPPGAGAVFLIIDHYAANTALPDYRVSVKSNGTVFFEGKRNVAFIGKIKFKISASAINDLQELFRASNFFTMRDQILWSPDLPINSTTYIVNRGEDGFKTLHDRESKPAQLVSLRQKAEDLLLISKYIIKNGPVLVSTDGTAVD